MQDRTLRVMNKWVLRSAGSRIFESWCGITFSNTIECSILDIYTKHINCFIVRPNAGPGARAHLAPLGHTPRDGLGSTTMENDKFVVFPFAYRIPLQWYMHNVNWTLILEHSTRNRIFLINYTGHVAVDEKNSNATIRWEFCAFFPVRYVTASFHRRPWSPLRTRARTTAQRSAQRLAGGVRAAEQYIFPRKKGLVLVTTTKSRGAQTTDVS